MTEEKLVTAEINIFYQMRGFKAHTKLLLPGTPTEATYKALLDRIEAAGGVGEFNQGDIPFEPTSEQMDVCSIHHKRRDGQYGPHCPTKLPDGSWCKWRPEAKAEA